MNVSQQFLAWTDGDKVVDVTAPGLSALDSLYSQAVIFFYTCSRSNARTYLTDTGSQISRCFFKQCMATEVPHFRHTSVGGERIGS